MYAFAGQALNNIIVMTNIFNSPTVPAKNSPEGRASMLARKDTYVATPGFSGIDDIVWNLVAILGNGYSHTGHTQDQVYVAVGHGMASVQNNVSSPGEGYLDTLSLKTLTTNNCTLRFGYTHPGQYYSNFNYAGQGAYWWAQ
jgi:hypothetical protein